MAEHLFAKSKDKRSKFGPCWPNVAKRWPKAGLPGHISAKLWSTLTDAWPRSNGLATDGPVWGNFWTTSELVATDGHVWGDFWTIYELVRGIFRGPAGGGGGGQLFNKCWVSPPSATVDPFYAADI